MAAAKKKPATKGASKKAVPKSATRSRSKAKRAQSGAVKKKADEAAKRAKAAGATGPKLSPARMALRNSMIVARRAQRVPWKDIAAEAGMSERGVKKVVEDAASVPSPVEDSPMELLEALAAGFLRSIGDYEGMAHAWADTNQAASLGAKKAADETRARLATLLHDVGKLPTDLEMFRSEMEMQRIAGEMVEMLREVAAGERDAAEAAEYFASLVRQGRERPQLTAA